MHYAIYTDGSAQPNPGLSGAAAILVAGNATILCKKTIALGISTNNRAELMGLLLATKIIQENISLSKEYLIYTDSKYVIGLINGNIARVNQDLTTQVLQQLSSLRASNVKVSVEHVFAHKNNKWNNLVDQLAKKAALD